MRHVVAEFWLGLGLGLLGLRLWLLLWLWLCLGLLLALVMLTAQLHPLWVYKPDLPCPSARRSLQISFVGLLACWWCSALPDRRWTWVVYYYQ